MTVSGSWYAASSRVGDTMMDDGKLRLIEPVMAWEDYVHLAVDEIRLAGAGSPQVARRLQSALRDLLSIAPSGRQAVLREELDLLSSATADAYAHERDVQLAQEPDAAGLGRQSS